MSSTSDTSSGSRFSRVFGRSGGGPFIGIFGLPFLGVGIGSLIYVGSCWLTYYQTAGWAQVPARIESASVKSDTGGDSTTYFVECHYTYVYGDRSYTGTRVGIMGGGSSDYSYHSRHAQILSRHAETGEPFTALVEPNHPDRSILFREVDPWMRTLIPFGLTFGLAGTACCGGGVYLMRASRRRDALRRELGDKPWLFRDDWRESCVKPSVAGLVMKWIMGLLAATLLTTLGMAFLEDSDAGLMPKIVITVLGSAFGLILLSGIRDTVARLVNGPVRLRLSERPLSPGMSLVAAVHGPERLRHARHARLSLIVTSGGGRSESKLHSEMTVVKPESFGDAGGVGVLVPVRFDLPANLPPVSDEQWSPVTWKLAFRTKGLLLGPSLEYHLPVFAAAAAQAQASGER